MKAKYNWTLRDRGDSDRNWGRHKWGPPFIALPGRDPQPCWMWKTWPHRHLSMPEASLESAALRPVPNSPGVVLGGGRGHWGVYPLCLPQTRTHRLPSSLAWGYAGAEFCDHSPKETRNFPCTWVGPSPSGFASLPICKPCQAEGCFAPTSHVNVNVGPVGIYSNFYFIFLNGLGSWG